MSDRDEIRNATWQQGTAEEFIQASQQGWERGVSILHFLGGTSIQLEGDRAATASTRSARASGERWLSGAALTP